MYVYVYIYILYHHIHFSWDQVLCHDGIPHELSGDGTAELRGIPGQALDLGGIGEEILGGIGSWL